MSSSWNTEEELKNMASELYIMASKLEDAAEILRSIREDNGIMERYKYNLKRAKSWMPE